MVFLTYFVIYYIYILLLILFIFSFVTVILKGALFIRWCTGVEPQIHFLFFHLEKFMKVWQKTPATNNRITMPPVEFDFF